MIRVDFICDGDTTVMGKSGAFFAHVKTKRWPWQLWRPFPASLRIGGMLFLIFSLGVVQLRAILPGAPKAMQPKDSIARYFVTTEIGDDGRTQMTESIRFVVGKGSKRHGVLRPLPTFTLNPETGVEDHTLHSLTYENVQLAWGGDGDRKRPDIFPEADPTAKDGEIRYRLGSAKYFLTPGEDTFLFSYFIDGAIHKKPQTTSSVFTWNYQTARGSLMKELNVSIVLPQSSEGTLQELAIQQGTSDQWVKFPLREPGSSTTIAGTTAERSLRNGGREITLSRAIGVGTNEKFLARVTYR